MVRVRVRVVRIPSTRKINEKLLQNSTSLNPHVSSHA